MKKRTINEFVLGTVVLTLALFGCSNGNVADTTAPGAAIDGAALYTSDCSGCHGPLAASGKKGASVSQIQDAIAHNWGGMGAFAGLTTDQLQAIATALAPVTTTNTPATTASLDGAALYADNCSSCHGTLAMSSKGGALASAIQAAIAGNFGGMGRFSNLTTAQLQAIADALASVQASTPGPAPATADGAALYAQYCSSCHGALATSSKSGATASRIQAGINNTNAMKSLSNLTSTQIQDIATALGASSPAPTPTTTDGAVLYTTYCSSCHGSLAASSKAGRTATQIQTAIGSVGSMSYLSNLTTTQVQAIASALAAAPAPAQTDGAALYTSYCSSCHGAFASSSVRGSSASTISSALSNVSQMMSISLTTTQIQAIATALGTTTTPSPTPAPSPSTTDGATLYDTYCASCHGPLATSNKSGATAAQIQTGITNNLGGMGQFSNLTSTQIQAIATALSTGTAPTTTTPVCGSCHAIPPATGHHTYHVTSQRVSCGTCHGTGYSSTTVNTATHNNGVVNVSTAIGWNPSTRSCSNSCHGTERW
ncbi:MAG: c-type cytochrome [Nitrospirota bacterium]